MKFRIGSKRRGMDGSWPESDDGRPLASKAGRNKRGKFVGFIVFAMFAIAGLVGSYFLLVLPIKNVIAARSWVETPCRILSAQVKSHSDSDGTTYSIDISYQYEFKGKTFICDRYNFMGGSSSGRSGKRAVVDKYRKAKNPVCFVNPDNPAQAVLVRGFQPMMLFGLIPLVFVAVGLGGIVGITRKSKRRIISKGARAAEWLPETKTARPDDNIYAPAGADSAGPVILRAKSSRLAKLLFLIIFAAFWNGVVSVFVVNIVKSFQAGRPQWGLAAFISIFVLVGLGVIIAVIHQFLALFNPKAKLTLSSSRIPLGSTAHLTWEILGRVNRISELVITLQAREECRYRRGTKTYTDKNTFFTFQLAQTTEPTQMSFGEVGFAVPAETMHSFTADNNKIIWSLNVAGDIKRWPDIKDEFDVTITPRQVDR
ncbi:MAG: DUF3592 domain-containing protein [Planctomycetes bacterium]|nr:DUF3592 domain-containing protein [Planctomycetota bacterium]